MIKHWGVKQLITIKKRGILPLLVDVMFVKLIVFTNTY